MTITYHCRVCDSINIVRNGTNRCDSPQYHCKDCGAYRVLEPSQAHTEEEKAMILRAYKERASMRGLERIFNVVRQTVAGCFFSAFFQLHIRINIIRINLNSLPIILHRQILLSKLIIQQTQVKIRINKFRIILKIFISF